MNNSRFSFLTNIKTWYFQQDHIARIKYSRYPVSLIDFILSLFIPTLLKSSSDAFIADIDNIEGLLNCQPSAPFEMSNSSRILNRFDLFCPHHPVNLLRDLFFLCLL